MALSNKTLQRKREKKKNKRKIKISSSMQTAMISYQNWPIHECWMRIDLWEMGIGQIAIARKNNQGDIAVGLYLVDVYCLGVKDCFVRLTDTYEYKHFLEQVEASCGEMKLVEANYANTVIIKAVEYANQLGFKPHHDFAKARRLLRGIPIDEIQEFIFGKDGKPLYVQGPYDSAADVRRVMKTLEANRGSENYNFLVEAPH
jgi:hypothetical protein